MRTRENNLVRRRRRFDERARARAGISRDYSAMARRLTSIAFENRVPDLIDARAPVAPVVCRRDDGRFNMT